jgi:hypothetical protein
MTERGKSYTVAYHVAFKVTCVLLAVGTYYLWHEALTIPSAPSVVGAVVIWCLPAPREPLR